VKKLESNAKGVYAIAVTPFTRDGAVDSPSVDRMTDFYLSCGVSGLTILGMMGEAAKLDPAEALAICIQVVRRASVPVIVGASAPGFAAMRSLARGAMEAGAAGVMIRAAPCPAHRRSDRQLLRASCGGNWYGYPVRDSGLSAGADRRDDPESHSANCDG